MDQAKMTFQVPFVYVQLDMFMNILQNAKIFF